MFEKDYKSIFLMLDNIAGALFYYMFLQGGITLDPRQDINISQFSGENSLPVPY